MNPVACPEHAELVRRALGPDATDADLDAYAEAVPHCAACARRLSVGAGVHPAHLVNPDPEDWERIQTRVALDDPAIARLQADLTPRRRWPLAIAALLAAAALVFALLPDDPTPSVPSPAPSVVVQPTPAPDPPPAPTPTPPPPRAPDPSDAVATLAPPEAPVDADWPAPPFEDLRGSTAKGATVRSLQLELDGTPAIGGSVRLAVHTTGAETVTLCVSGAENGVVWRGAVPGGRVLLTRDARAVRYAFPTHGTYQLSLATGDSERCERPVHQIEVQL